MPKLDLRFRPSQRLRTKGDYETVFNARNRQRTTHLTIYYCINECGHDRLGLTVSKRLGGAVIRNRIKRKIREIFRTNPLAQEPYLDLVIRPEKSFDLADYQDIESSWCSTIKRLKGRMRDK